LAAVQTIEFAQLQTRLSMHATLQKAITRLLAPLVRVLLRHGVSHAEFSSWAKQTYVEQAHQNFGIDGKKPTVSRLAIVTGINRKEVKRILELPADATPALSKHNRAIRVVTGWLQDSQYRSADGEPKTLTYGDASASFNQLVKQYGGDVPARAVLDELLRVGTVIQTDNQVSLAAKGYVPHESEEAMLELFATSARDLLTTLDHNVSGTDKPRLQMSVAYDDVGEEGVKAFRQLSSKKALALLQELDKSLSQDDRGVNPTAGGTGRYRTGLGVYFVEEMVEDDQSDAK
jgi:hypothetical protein